MGGVQWEYASALAWDSKGSKLAIGVGRPLDPASRRFRTTVHIYDPRAETLYAVPGWTAPTGLVFSPDSTRLAFLAWAVGEKEKVGYLVIADLRSNAQTSVRLPEGIVFTPQPFWSEDGERLAVPGFKPGRGPGKAWAERFVWVGDAQCRPLAWYPLPSGPAERSMCYGWLGSGHTLVGINITGEAPEVTRKPGAYLWTLDTEAAEGLQFRSLSGLPSGAGVALDVVKRQGALAFSELSSPRQRLREPVVVISLPEAKASVLRKTLGRGGRWAVSEGGKWIAVLKETPLERVIIYKEGEYARDFPIPPHVERARPALAWGPGAEEVTVSTGAPHMAVVVIECDTGKHRVLLRSATRGRTGLSARSRRAATGAGR